MEVLAYYGAQASDTFGRNVAGFIDAGCEKVERLRAIVRAAADDKREATCDRNRVIDDGATQKIPCKATHDDRDCGK